MASQLKSKSVVLNGIIAVIHLNSPRQSMYMLTPLIKVRGHKSRTWCSIRAFIIIIDIFIISGTVKIIIVTNYRSSVPADQSFKICLIKQLEYTEKREVTELWGK